MKTDNPFDRHLEAVGTTMPESLRTASTFLADRLDLSWKIAQSVFESNATPEHALAIYDRLLLALPDYAKK